MKGLVEVNRKTGQVYSQLVAEHSNSNSPQELTPDELEKLGQSLTFIMQDVNLYSKRNGG